MHLIIDGLDESNYDAKNDRIYDIIGINCNIIRSVAGMIGLTYAN